MYPSFFRKVLLTIVHSIVVKGLVSTHTANRKTHSHTISAVSRQVYMHALLVQHL